MRRLITVLVIHSLFFLTAGCGTLPPAADGTGETLAGPDFEAGPEALFMGSHARILEKIDGMENAGGVGVLLFEIKTIVRIAEEEYLRGEVLLAVELLEEAEALVRKIP